VCLPTIDAHPAAGSEDRGEPERTTPNDGDCHPSQSTQIGGFGGTRRHQPPRHLVSVVSEAVRADEARLREAVNVARAHDRSWNQVAVALGVSRQAARQRFTDKTHA